MSNPRKSPFVQAEKLAIGENINRIDLSSNHKAIIARLNEIESNCKKVRGQLKEAFKQ